MTDSLVNQIIFETKSSRPRSGIVVMDNLSRHKGPAVGGMNEVAATRLLYLSPYSPNFNLT